MHVTFGIVEEGLRGIRGDMSRTYFRQFIEVEIVLDAQFHQLGSNHLGGRLAVASCCAAQLGLNCQFSGLCLPIEGFFCTHRALYESDRTAMGA